MGEIADMMLEGDVCGTCGCYIDSEGGDGIPRYCSDECDPFHDEDTIPVQQQAKKPKSPAARLQSITDKMIALLQKELPATTGSRKQLFVDLQKLIAPFIIPTEEKK